MESEEGVGVVLAGHRLVVRRGSRLLDLCDARPELPFTFGCREGGCGMCLVRVEPGSGVNVMEEVERIMLDVLVSGEPRARLGCQIRIEGTATIEPWSDAP